MMTLRLNCLKHHCYLIKCNWTCFFIIIIKKIAINLINLLIVWKAEVVNYLWADLERAVGFYLDVFAEVDV